MSLPYDQTDPKAIEAYGSRLIGKTLASQPGAKKIPEDILEAQISGVTRGSFGTTLEKFYFGITPGNESAPDFKEAGVELKSTPIKYSRDGMPAAKERLVLNMIDYVEEAKITRFEDSNVYKKNKEILLVSYEHGANRAAVKHPIRVVHMLKFHDLPAEDQLIIRKDWEKIVSKIREGKAHELSEGDTDYLGACTKAASSRNTRAQANDGPPAKPRAFSLKGGYMTVTLRKLLAPKLAQQEYESIIDSPRSFEDEILNRLNKFAGDNADEIMRKLNASINPAQKGFLASLARRMMGVKGHKVEELEKADIQMKIIRVLPNSMPKESMSFPAMKFNEFISEEWDSGIEGNQAKLQEILERRFLFIVFEIQNRETPSKASTFKKAFFWTMPYEDRMRAKETWETAKQLVSQSMPTQLPKESQTQVIHVRPHGKNKNDVDVLPNGHTTTKRSFWINKRYIAKQVEN